MPDLFGHPPPDSPLARLLDGPLAPGRIVWIGLRPARRAPVRLVPEAMARPGQGLDGDRYASTHAGARQITLIAQESLHAIAAFLNRPEPDPARLRRNLVTSGINLAALRHRRFRAGAALLEWSGEAHPCSRMEEELGPGGYNAVRGQGGITACVIEPGPIRLGDAVERVLP